MDTETEQGTPVRLFSIMLLNRVGAMASVAKLLKAKGIAIIGISVVDSCDSTIVRLVISDPESAQDLFMEKGISYSMSDVIVLSLAEAGPYLVDCLETFMMAETNIHYMTSLLPSPRGESRIAIRCEDYEFASVALQNAGFKLIYQEDLSR